jgi:hypothetical protein
MAHAVNPRQRDLSQVLARLLARVRRLEITNNLPHAAVATYSATYSGGSAATTWTPDFTAATSTRDDIGLTLSGGGVLIPQGWLAVVNAGFVIAQSSAPPTGEAVVWSLVAGLGGQVNRQDVMTNTTDQALEATIPAPSGWAASNELPVTLGVVSTVLGTEFTPTSAYFSMWAIQLPTAGWPTGDVE